MVSSSTAFLPDIPGFCHKRAASCQDLPIHLRPVLGYPGTDSATARDTHGHHLITQTCGNGWSWARLVLKKDL